MNVYAVSISYFDFLIFPKEPSLRMSVERLRVSNPSRSGVVYGGAEITDFVALQVAGATSWLPAHTEVRGREICSW